MKRTMEITLLNGPNTFILADDVDRFHLQMGKDEIIAADP